MPPSRQEQKGAPEPLFCPLVKQCNRLVILALLVEVYPHFVVCETNLVSQL